MLLPAIAIVTIVVVLIIRDFGREPPPSDTALARGRLLVFIANAAGMSAHIWWAKALAIPDLASGSVYYGGPGDALYFAVFILAPLLVAILLNLPLARVCTRSMPRALALWCMIVVGWLLLPGLEDSLWGTSCPEGVRCAGS